MRGTQNFAALLVALLMAVPLHGQTQQAFLERPSRYSSVYDDQTIAYWRGRYEPHIRENFDTLLAYLSPSERAAIANVRLDVSLRDPDDPFGYNANAARIRISAASVKFFDDIALATAWLLSNRYSNESVAYYADVLKYRRPIAFSAGVYPQPLPALGIPANASSDASVNDPALKILSNAIVFIMAHEIGHVLYRHDTAGTAREKQQKEMQADAFAIEMFRRMGAPPLGLPVFLFVATFMTDNRGDFDSDSAYAAAIARASHPITGIRLKALANAIRQSPDSFLRHERDVARMRSRLLSTANDIEGIGNLLDDSLLQRHSNIVGLQIPLAELRPRRPNESWVPAKLP